MDVLRLNGHTPAVVGVLLVGLVTGGSASWTVYERVARLETVIHERTSDRYTAGDAQRDLAMVNSRIARNEADIAEAAKRVDHYLDRINAGVGELAAEVRALRYVVMEREQARTEAGQ